MSSRTYQHFRIWQRLGTGCVILAGLYLMLSSAAFAQTPERPNVLFIFLDDYGWRDAGFMGSDFYETPNIDRLASEGMVFTNAYSCAANCAPALACLLSGQYTPRHEIYNVGTGRRGKPNHGKLMHIPGTDTLRTDIITWAHCVQKAGYRTGTIGKWHLSKDPRPYGFDVNVGGSHSGSPPRGYFPPHPGAPGLQDAPDGEYLTDRLHDAAIEFVEDNKDRPWFLYLTHFAVHTPLQAGQDLQQKYEKKDAGTLHDSAVMAAMIESVDQGVGRLVAKLDQLGLTDKTAVIFFSDNGGHGPATSMRPLKGYKGNYYEGGIREPFFIKWPNVVPAGTKCDEPIIGVDLYPTLCEITGADLPSDQPLDGVNISPLFRGQENLEPRALYWHFPAYLQGYARINDQRDPLYRTRPCGIIRYGDWKLHEYFEDGDLELYNLKEDVSETTNLASSMPKKTEQLHQMLVEWRRSIQAPVPTEPNPKFDAEAESAAIDKILKSDAAKRNRKKR